MEIAYGTLLFLVFALGTSLLFECINGFHDTANAVATVIYTKSLKPQIAVVWSGFMNFLGVLLGGIAVAFSIVHLLPVDLLVKIDTGAGMAMVMALLLSAIIWNFGTWYLAIPASSSHTLIGAIIGVGLANSYLAGHFGTGINWHKAWEVGLSLLISPLIGFALAAGLLILLKRLVKNPELYHPPDGDKPPPWWIRAILILTCTGVSFAHGSNDGQKGIGLIMLILIGLVPSPLCPEHGTVSGAIPVRWARQRATFRISSAIPRSKKRWLLPDRPPRGWRFPSFPRPAPRNTPWRKTPWWGLLRKTDSAIPTCTRCRN